MFSRKLRPAASDAQKSASSETTDHDSWLSALTYIVLSCMALSVSDGAISAEGVVTVPLTFGGNRPIFAATINGHSFPLMFDLGEDADLVLTQSALDELQLRPGGAGQKVGDIKGNTMESATFIVPQLQIGTMMFRNVAGRVDVHDPSYQAAQVGNRGYIGPSLVHDYQIVLNYQRGQMTFIPKQSSQAANTGCTGTTVPFLPEWDGAPVTRVKTDSGELILLWDTGAPTSLMRSSLVEQAHPNSPGKAFATRHLFLNGTDFGPLELRAFDFSEPPGIDGFIGGNFFANHVVCIDLPRNRFLIQR